MPYILNVWTDDLTGRLEVHLYRANHPAVVVLETERDAIKWLWRAGEVEVWAFDAAGDLGLYRIDWLPRGAVVGDGFPLPPLAADQEPASRSLEAARRAPPQLRPDVTPAETWVESLRPRAKWFQRITSPAANDDTG